MVETAPNVSSDTTYNFTIRASDGSHTTDRDFSLGIMAASDPKYYLDGSVTWWNWCEVNTSGTGGYFTTGNNHRSSGGGRCQ